MGSSTLPRCWQTLPTSDTERSPGHAASCQKFPSRQAQSLLPCHASLGPSTGESLTSASPVRARRGGATAHMGEKPCVIPPLPVIGKWPLHGGWAAVREHRTGSHGLQSAQDRIPRAADSQHRMGSHRLWSARTAQDRIPRAAHHFVPNVREVSPGSSHWGVTAAWPESDRATPEHQEAQVARARAPHISCIRLQQAAQHPVPVRAWLCQAPL